MNLAVTNRQNLGITRTLPTARMSDIGHEDDLSGLMEADYVKAFGVLAVRPTALEVGPSIDAVIERAAEVEILGDELL